MYRGTTPTLVLTLKTFIDFQNVDKLYVTIQSKLKSIDIDKSRCVLDNENKTIQFTLTQEETLQFNVSNVEIQVRMKLKDGKVYASSIANVEMNKILKDGVI